MAFRFVEQYIPSLEDMVSSKTHPAEFTFAFLFLLSGLKFADSNWLQLKKMKVFSSDEDPHLQLTTALLAEWLRSSVSKECYEKSFAKIISRLPKDSPLLNLWTQMNWKTISARSLQSLRLWSQNRYRLVLRDRAIAPFELLDMQSRGSRCVTVFRQFADLQKIYEHKRDALDFTVHDLEHAHLFFDPLSHEMQRTWSRFLSCAFSGDSPWAKHFDDRDPEFAYLISDMNTHPWHGFMTLRNLWLKRSKTTFNLMGSERMNDQQEKEHVNSWNEFVRYFTKGSTSTIDGESFSRHLQQWSTDQNGKLTVAPRTNAVEPLPLST